MSWVRVRSGTTLANAGRFIGLSKAVDDYGGVDFVYALSSLTDRNTFFLETNFPVALKTSSEEPI